MTGAVPPSVHADPRTALPSARQGGRARNRLARIPRRLAVALLAAVSLLVTAQAASANLVPNMNDTIVYVHGFNLNSQVDCNSTWSQDISWMQSMGWTGRVVKVGYYTTDTNCDVNLHSYGSYGDQDSWKSIAAAFSHYIYNNFTSKGITVDLVGYSMGGLVVRGAVYGAQSGASGFSAPLNVSDAVTFGSPFDGAAWYAQFCSSAQCQSMVQGSPDLNWLNQNGNPQGTQGTTWSTFGSQQDDVVPWQSAIFMSIPIDHQIVWQNISHTGTCCHPSYLQSWDVANRATSAIGTKPGKITSGINTAKCVDVQHSNTADGTPVQIYDCNGTGAQVWTHTFNGKTVLTALGKCLDVTGANGSPGTKVQLWNCNTGTNQEWTIGSDHSLRSLGYCLDDPNSNTTNSTQLQIWTCNGTNAQKWYFA